MSEPANQPYQDLGLHLKQLREKFHESVAEVSGAVEIDEDALVRIEQGERRPSEDVLMLLMSHFNMQEEESVKLWELAGYDKPRPTLPGIHEHGEEQKPPHLIMVMQSDTRVLYSDMVQVTVNDHGVVLGFLQTAANSGGPSQLVARIGMSKEHARSVSKLIEESLHKADQPQSPKLLPGPSDKTKDKKQ